MFVKKYQTPDFIEWWWYPKEFRYNRIIVQRASHESDDDLWGIFWQPGQKGRGILTLGTKKGREEAEEFAQNLMDFAAHFTSLKA